MSYRNESLRQGETYTGSVDKNVGSKYTYRSVCSIILTSAFSCLFFHVWFQFVEEHNQTGHLLGKANLLMSLLIYVGLIIVFFRWFKGFKIGVYRKSNILASQVSALFMINIAEIFVSMAITGQFRFFYDFLWRYALLFLVESVVDFALTLPMVDLYRKLFPPMKVVEIYGKYTAASRRSDPLFAKINGRADKYVVKQRLSCKENITKITEAIDKWDAVVLNDLPNQEERILLKLCFDTNKRVYFTPKISDIIVKASENLNLFDTPLYLCRNDGMTYWQRFWKRTFDIVFSLIVLLVTSPIFLAVAIAIKLDDHGPVFFRQERVTIGGKKFQILKFRSMREETEEEYVRPTGNDDDRITKVGNFIRKTRIDELPQFVNILFGDMSVVGPRPERVEHVEMYCDQIPEFCLREKVKGGLTGYAQVYGKYNTTALDKLKMDMIYIMNYSWLLDIQIIFETIKVVFSKESTEGFTDEQQEEVRRFTEKAE